MFALVDSEKIQLFFAIHCPVLLKRSQKYGILLIQQRVLPMHHIYVFWLSNH